MSASTATANQSRSRRAPGMMDRLRGQADIVKWNLRGRPSPPPHAIKVQAIESYARELGLNCLIETGTYLGDMVARTRHLFDRIFSIEVDPVLCKNAQNRFAADDAITILLGDSAKVLPQVLEQWTAPAIFWLDGHYSGGATGKGDLDTPIMAEMETILAAKQVRHAILVDDARLFDGTNDYPKLGDFQRHLLKLRPDYRFEVSNDIIRFTPSK